MKPDRWSGTGEAWVEPPPTQAEKRMQRQARRRRKMDGGPAVRAPLELFPPTLADLGPRRPAPAHQSYTVMKRGGLAGPGVTWQSVAEEGQYGVQVIKRAADHTVLKCGQGHQWTADEPCYSLIAKRDWVCQECVVEQRAERKRAKAEARAQRKLEKAQARAKKRATKKGRAK